MEHGVRGGDPGRRCSSRLDQMSGWYYSEPKVVTQSYRADSAAGLERTPGTDLDLSALALCHLLYLEQKVEDESKRAA